MATVFKRGGKGNRGGYYYVSWFDHTGKRRTKCAKTTDKAAAERLAAKLETEAMERRSGLIDATAEAIGEQTRRSIESHLADYEAKLQAGKRDARHVRSTLKYVRDIANAAGWETVGDIEADGVNRFAQTLNDGGKSARTIQAHLRAIKSFARWLATHRKLAHDPLASVVPPNPKANRRRERRMLLPAEWPWLRYAAENGPERFKTTGAERLLLYSTAIQTGLRSGELRSLKRGRLYLDAEPPYVTCKAGNTKNAKDARQYIQRDLANALRNHAATKTPTAHVFAMPDESDVADMLRADLADARRAWLDAAKNEPAERLRREQSDFLSDANHDGERLDFHALRHTCGAWAAMSGAHPKAVQALMRHSTITLTMDTYGHLFPGQEAETVARLPTMLADGWEPMRATGTADTAAKCDANAPAPAGGAQRWAQQLAHVSGQSDATPCDNADADPRSDKGRNPLQDAAFRVVTPHDATPCESAPRRTRTFDPLIKSLRGSAEIAGKTADSEAGAALGAAVGAELGERVARLIEAWPTLDDDRRRAVLAMLDGVVSMIESNR